MSTRTDYTDYESNIFCSYFFMLFNFNLNPVYGVYTFQGYDITELMLPIIVSENKEVTEP